MTKLIQTDDKDIYSILRERVKFIAQQKHTSIAKLMREAGLSPYIFYDTRKRAPRASTIANLCTSLGVKPSELFAQDFPNNLVIYWKLNVQWDHVRYITIVNKYKKLKVLPNKSIFNNVACRKGSVLITSVLEFCNITGCDIDSIFIINGFTLVELIDKMKGLNDFYNILNQLNDRQLQKDLYKILTSIVVNNLPKITREMNLMSGIIRLDKRALLSILKKELKKYVINKQNNPNIPIL